MPASLMAKRHHRLVFKAATYAAVSQMMQAGGARMQLTLQGINDAVLRITTSLGQRTIVFLSAGIYVGEQQAALTDYLNRAIRAGVVINTLDIKGLVRSTRKWS